MRAPNLLIAVVCVVSPAVRRSPPPCSPEAAESYFISLAGNSSSSLRDVGSLTSSTYTSGELDSPLAAGSSVTGRFSQRALAAPNGSGSAAAGALGPDHFPAWREVSGPSASALLAVPGDMTVMAAVELPGITARTLAEVSRHS